MTVVRLHFDRSHLPAETAAAFPNTSMGAEPRLGWWLTILSSVVAGYALFGKSFAYLGLPPFFIGELALITGLVSTICFCRWRTLLDSPCVWIICLLCMWGLVRTLPYLSTYRFESLRDAAQFGYSAFALFVMAHLVTEPERLVALIERYRKFAIALVFCLPPIWVASRVLKPVLPNWPWAEVSILDVKGGDFGVHMAGALAFWVAFAGQRYGQVRWLPLVMLGLTVGMAGAESRSGLLAFLLVLGLCFLTHPRNRSLWQLVLMGVLGLTLLGLSGLNIESADRERSISFEQIVENVTSMFSSGSKTGDLEGTKEWRLLWWNDIIDYTWNGPYFWTGKGFGINLADDDGYQGTEDGILLRSPHNGHLTILARAGIPGFILWLLVLGVWCCQIVYTWFRCQLRAERTWGALFFVLFCYLLALCTQASFDVYFEGPVGGIWFWTVYGVGLAALWLYRHCPEILYDEDPLRA